MKDLIDLLRNPFDKVSKGNKKGFQKECGRIANDLFSNFCVQCGDTCFRLAEVEFYYYEKGKWEDKWNNMTYPRDGYKAGDLFYHLSGIDICFESFYSVDRAKFGGILIRAIKNDQGTVIAGPLNCKDEILNACRGGKMAELKRSSQKCIPAESTYRALGKNDIDKDNDRLCFYDGQIIDWTPEKDRYNTKTGTIEKRKGTYKLDRFNR